MTGEIARPRCPIARVRKSGVTDFSALNKRLHEALKNED